MAVEEEVTTNDRPTIEPVKQGHVVLLPSSDGDQWTHAIVVGPDLEGRTVEEVHEIAESVMDAVKKNVGEEWHWGDFEEPFLQSGFQLPTWSHGPQWD